MVTKAADEQAVRKMPDKIELRIMQSKILGLRFGFRKRTPDGNIIAFGSLSLSWKAEDWPLRKELISAFRSAALKGEKFFSAQCAVLFKTNQSMKRGF